MKIIVRERVPGLSSIALSLSFGGEFATPGGSLSVRIASQYRFFPVSAVAQRDYGCSNADFNMAVRAIEYPQRRSDTSCSKIYQKIYLYVQLFLLVQACTTLYAVPLGYR